MKLYSKLIQRGKVTEVFTHVKGYLPGHIKMSLDRKGGEIVDSDEIEFLRFIEDRWSK